MIDFILRRFRMNRATKESSTGDSCVACEGTDVELLAPQTYRCNACGHEGGDGWSAYNTTLRHASFARMSVSDRRDSAREDLLEARLLLSSGIGDLDRSHTEGTLDTFGLHGVSDSSTLGEGTAKIESMRAGVELVNEAQDHIGDALVKLYGERNSPEDVAPDSHKGHFVDLYFDNIFSDLRFLGSLNKVRTKANELSRVVDETLAREFPE